jgi:DNA mismatch repair protein MutH
MPLYDENDADSIITFAKKLEGKDLRGALREQGRENELARARKACGKGSLGNLVQDAYFGQPANSRSVADFEKVGLELKTTPLKNTKKGWRSKERLVLNLIDFKALSQEYDFETSTFWKKNHHLLLLFYMYVKGIPLEELVFKIVRDWKFPKADLKIIRDDWNQIVAAVRAQRAHELSERDTLYLGACTKGSTSKTTRKQISGPDAKSRAFSLKSSYLNRIIDESLAEDAESIFDDVEVPEEISFEEWVVEQFMPFYGKTLPQLCERFGLKTKAKHVISLVGRAILGVKKQKIEEFERAGVIMKTVRLDRKGGLKESMSFHQIKFVELVEQTWEESDFFSELDKRFFFLVFKDDENGTPVLYKAVFWSIPQKDMDQVRKVWEDTKRKVIAGRYDDFIKMKDNQVAHVRPKGRDSRDLGPTPQGVPQKKKCFWLNSRYILEQIR